MPCTVRRRQRVREALRGLVVVEVLRIGLVVVVALGIQVGALVLWLDLAYEAFIAAAVVPTLGCLALAVRARAAAQR